MAEVAAGPIRSQTDAQRILQQLIGPPTPEGLVGRLEQELRAGIFPGLANRRAPLWISGYGVVFDDLGVKLAQGHTVLADGGAPGRRCLGWQRSSSA